MSLCRGVGGSKKLLTPLRNVEMVPKEIIVQFMNCNYELRTQEFCLTTQMKGLYVGSLKKAKLLEPFGICLLNSTANLPNFNLGICGTLFITS